MKFCKLSLIAFLLLTTSCTLTKSLWQQSYEENFDEFLISENRDYIAFVGKKYNYVFEDEMGVMGELLRSHQNNIAYIDPTKTYIHVDSQNNISGYALIKSFAGSLTKQEEIKLLAMGFRSNKEDGLSKKIILKGHRYQNSQINFGENRHRLERFYILPVNYPPGFGGTMLRLIATPFTIVVDALWDVEKAIAYPLSL